jgi:tRNA G18 (ribose-2'-O)-methylase SpoU
MKVRLNLTIEENLLNKIKRHAASKHVSVSELVEEYFKTITKQRKHNNIIDLVERLPNHSVSPSQNLKKEFYKDYI